MSRFGHEEMPFDLTLPANIRELLDSGLRDAGLPGSNTAKFEVEGHPELLVRLNKGTPYEYALSALFGVAQVIEHGVNVVPFRPVPHRGEAYVVVQKVHGEDVESGLTHHLADELLASAEKNWQLLGQYLIGQMVSGGSMVTDIYEPCQYMYGTTATDQTPKMRLVDLPERATFPSEDPKAYNARLSEWVDGLTRVELLAGRPLHDARQTAEEAFTLSLQAAPDSADAVANLRFMLDQS